MGMGEGGRRGAAARASGPAASGSGASGAGRANPAFPWKRRGHSAEDRPSMIQLLEPRPLSSLPASASPRSSLPRPLQTSRSRRLWSLLSRWGVRVFSHSYPLVAQFFTSFSSSCCYFFLQPPPPCSPVPLPSPPPCRGSGLRHHQVSLLLELHFLF